MATSPLLREPTLALLRLNIRRLDIVHVRRAWTLVQVLDELLQRALVALGFSLHLMLVSERTNPGGKRSTDTAIRGVPDGACDAEAVCLLGGERAVFNVGLCSMGRGGRIGNGGYRKLTPEYRDQ